MFDQLLLIDLVLVSYNYYDYFDLEILCQFYWCWLMVKVVSGLGNVGLICQIGFVDVVEIDWWQVVLLGVGLMLYGVLVQYWLLCICSDINCMFWFGFVIDLLDGLLLFFGDIGFGLEFGLIYQCFGVMCFVVLLIGVYELCWFMCDYYMNFDDVVQVYCMLQVQISMVIYFGIFNFIDEQQDDLFKVFQVVLCS